MRDGEHLARASRSADRAGVERLARQVTAAPSDSSMLPSPKVGSAYANTAPGPLPCVAVVRIGAAIAEATLCR